MRMDVLRMFLSEVKKVQIDSGKTLDNAGIAAVARKLIKQRRDSAQQFQDAGRTELAERETAEIAVLEKFVPAAPSTEQLSAAVDEALSACQAASLRDMGKVMAHIKQSLPDVDMSEVGKVVKQKLAEK